MSTLPSVIQGRKESAWLAGVRQEARQRYDTMSWPTPEDEEWRRTDITAFEFDRYRLAEAETAPKEGTVELADGVAGVIRFAGGRLVGAVLRPDLIKAGVLLQPLGGEVQDDMVRPLFDRAISEADNRVAAWHYSLWTHGALLRVPEGVEIKDPIVAQFEEDGQDVLTTPHLSVILEKGAHAVVVQCLSSSAESRVLCNGGVDLAVAESARLDYFEEQTLSLTSTWFSHTNLVLGRDAEVRHFSASLGSHLVKTRLTCEMAGAGANVALNGIYLATGDQHVDIRTVQRHRAPQTYSRTYYKGAVRDKGRSIFQGLIDVDHDAPGTDAFLTNNNMVLNSGARADSIPSLAINQDDVRCSHGSTTGKVNELEVFYLMTRGFSRSEAERMLVIGYFQEVLDKTPALVREILGERIQERL